VTKLTDKDRADIRANGGQVVNVKRNSKEWHRMWAALADRPEVRGDTEQVHNLETWQYLGTTAEGHEFRHRCHPDTGRRMIIVIPKEVA
jgi:hypothetical protein